RTNDATCPPYLRYCWHGQVPAELARRPRHDCKALSVGGNLACEQGKLQICEQRLASTADPLGRQVVIHFLGLKPLALERGEHARRHGRLDCRGRHAELLCLYGRPL